MAQTSETVDGGTALDIQENTLSGLEQALSAKVIRYSKTSDSQQSGAKQNTAVLEDVPIGEALGLLHLQAFDVNANTSAVVAQQTQAGRTLAFQGVAFVSGAEKLVLGFR